MGEPEVYETADQSHVRKSWRAHRNPLTRLHYRLQAIDPRASWSLQTLAADGIARCSFVDGRGRQRTLVHVCAQPSLVEAGALALLWMLDDAGEP